MARPLRLPREELRAAILAAARDLLEREGLSGLSARALAREIGYTAASIYSVFDSMSDVLMEVNRATFGEMRALIGPMLAPSGEGTARARLEAVVQGYVGFMQGNPALWTALFGGIRRRESFPDWYMAAIDQLMEALAALVGQCAEEVAEGAAAKLTAQEARRHAERLYVSVHGALALDLEHRLDMISGQSALDLAQYAVAALLRQVASREARA